MLINTRSATPISTAIFPRGGRQADHPHLSRCLPSSTNYFLDDSQHFWWGRVNFKVGVSDMTFVVSLQSYNRGSRVSAECRDESYLIGVGN